MISVSACGHLLKEGTPSGAKFNEDGSGEWLALNEFNMNLLAEFGDLAGILVSTRGAADLVKETPLDRAESSAMYSDMGEVAVILTNNVQRGADEIGPRFLAKINRSGLTEKISSRVRAGCGLIYAQSY